MASEKTASVPALERGLQVLELVAKSKNGFTFSQLARQLEEIPKSSVHCILITLDRLGYLRRIADSGRYVAGPNLVHLANAAQLGIMLRQKVGPTLAELTQRTGLTAHLAVLDSGEALLIAKTEPAWNTPMATWIGKRIDYHCTSLGKALIAWLTDEEITRLVKTRRMLRHNENTIGSLAKLREELRKTRQRGYSIDDEEEEIGVRCIGAPIFGSGGQVEAALSVSGSTEQIGRESVAVFGALVREAARTVAREVGWTSAKNSK